MAINLTIGTYKLKQV